MLCLPAEHPPPYHPTRGRGIAPKRGPPAAHRLLGTIDFFCFLECLGGWRSTEACPRARAWSSFVLPAGAGAVTSRSAAPRRLPVCAPLNLPVPWP